MATRNIVPRANGEGSIGTAAKHWGAGYFDTLPSWQEYLAESTGYGIVSGCEPSISGLTVTVGAGIVHLADGTRKEISASTVTLDSADTTNPRIDLVYITSAGAVAKVTGVAAASPVVPALPSGGIKVCVVTVAANASTGTVVDRRDMLPRWYNTGIVNVKDFGAVGDGVQDDSAAFEAAISAAENKILYIPDANYVINEWLFSNNVKKVCNLGRYVDVNPFSVSDINTEELCNDIYPYPIALSAKVDDNGNLRSNQGLCCKKTNGIVTEIYYTLTNTSNTKTEIVKFTRELDNDVPVWNFVLSNELTVLSHAENMTFIGDYIYILNDSTQTLYKIDSSTLQVNSSVSFDCQSSEKISYDDKTGMLVSFVVNSSNATIRFFDPELNLIKTINKALDFDTHIIQNIVARNGVIYILSWEYINPPQLENYNYITCIDYGGDFIKHINVNISAEAEGIDIDDSGYVYLSFHEFGLSISNGFNAVCECPLVETRLDSARTPIDYRVRFDRLSTPSMEIHVDSVVTNTRHWGVGLGTTNNPYLSIGASNIAIKSIADSCSGKTIKVIYHHTDTPNKYDYKLVLNGITNPIELSHATYNTYDKADAGVGVLARAEITCCNNVKISYIKFYYPGLSLPLYVRSSQVYLIGTIFKVDSGDNVAFQYSDICVGYQKMKIENGTWNLMFSTWRLSDTTRLIESGTTRNFGSYTNLFTASL